MAEIQASSLEGGENCRDTVPCGWFRGYSSQDPVEKQNELSNSGEAYSLTTYRGLEIGHQNQNALLEMAQRLLEKRACLAL